MSNAAMSHQVVLRSGGPGANRFVVYGVSADDPNHAAGLALEFEARCGDASWEVHSLQQIAEPDEGPTGVYWRSDETSRPPGPLPSGE